MIRRYYVFYPFVRTRVPLYSTFDSITFVLFQKLRFRFTGRVHSPPYVVRVSGRYFNHAEMYVFRQTFGREQRRKDIA